MDTHRDGTAPLDLTDDRSPRCAGADGHCAICGQGAGGELAFSFAYQPIVDLSAARIYAHEALVRGPAGQSAASVLDRIGDSNRYHFDQACRVKAIDLACDLGLLERSGEKLSINFLPHAVYRPEVCIQTTLQIARRRGLDLSSIVFKVTEGERIDDGPWFAEILREYRRQGFLTAIDDFGAGYAGLRLLADFQPDLIKLDMGLVRHVDTRPALQAIARSAVRPAQELGIDKPLVRRNALKRAAVHDRGGSPARAAAPRRPPAATTPR